MTSRWKEVQSDEEIDDLRVELRPILGVDPRVYVPALWATLLLLVAFFLLVFPGVRAFGSRLIVTSSPEGASVFVDDQRLGSTPLEEFVPAGTHRIRVALGTSVDEREVDVRGRRFGSLFFPRVQSHAVILDGDDGVDGAVALEDAIDVGVREFAAWALNGEPSERFQQPPTAHETARQIWASRSVRNANPETANTIDRFRDDLVAHAAAPQIRDLTAAVLRTGSPGAAFSPMSVSDAVRYFIQLDNDSPAVGRLVDALAPQDAVVRRVLTATEWLTARDDALSTALLAGSLGPDERAMPAVRRAVTSAGTFVRVPAGQYLLGYPLQDPDVRGVPVRFSAPFWIQDREVTNRRFAAFVAAVPEWAPAARDELVRQGVVDDDYLRGWPEDWRARWIDGAADPAADPAAEQPVRWVSWAAAAAYVDWLNEMHTLGGIPGSGPDSAARFRYALPSAAQWEYAAFLNDLQGPTVVADAARPQGVNAAAPGALGAYHMSGNVWEWTASWYARNDDVVRPTRGDQRVVAGGSYATGQAGHNLLGAQPPEWATPFLGFRVAVVMEEEHTQEESTVKRDG